MGTEWATEQDLLATEADEWDEGVSEDTLRTDGETWRAKPGALDPNAAAANTILGFGGWDPFELRVTPEEFNVTPEESQSDTDDWTIQSDPE